MASSLSVQRLTDDALWARVARQARCADSGLDPDRRAGGSGASEGCSSLWLPGRPAPQVMLMVFKSIRGS